MSGFRNIAELVAAFDAGKTWQSTFRKQLGATATVTGQWYDFAYAGGNPIPNYYAAAPLESSLLDPAKGIIVPRMAAGKNQFIHRLTLQMAAGAAASTAVNDMAFTMLDYLLFYPFVDMDDTSLQAMTETDALTRYTDGIGVQVMMVAQAPTVGGGQFTVTYVGTDDVEYTTPTLFCAAAQPAGALVMAVGAAGGLTPFMPLAVGVKGVKRIVSTTFSVVNGGLACLVLVKPLMSQYFDEASRINTDSFGTATEKEAMRLMPMMSEIKDGAFLGLIGRGPNGSYASAVLTGLLETVWN